MGCQDIATACAVAALGSLGRSVLQDVSNAISKHVYTLQRNTQTSLN